jgi:hypothetical protein
LELHPEKTRLIEFGPSAAERRKKRGQGKPETFNFLGFTHMCGTSQKAGYFVVKRKTIGKRMAFREAQRKQSLARWCAIFWSSAFIFVTIGTRASFLCMSCESHP